MVAALFLLAKHKAFFNFFGPQANLFRKAAFYFTGYSSLLFIGLCKYPHLWKIREKRDVWQPKMTHDHDALWHHNRKALLGRFGINKIAKFSHQESRCPLIRIISTATDDTVGTFPSTFLS